MSTVSLKDSLIVQNCNSMDYLDVCFAAPNYSQSILPVKDVCKMTEMSDFFRWQHLQHICIREADMGSMFRQYKSFHMLEIWGLEWKQVAGGLGG